MARKTRRKASKARSTRKRRTLRAVRRRRNPRAKHRKIRRLRRNPGVGSKRPTAKQARIEQMIGEQNEALVAASTPKRKRSRPRKLSKKQRSFRKRMLARAKRVRSTAQRKWPKGAKLTASQRRARRARLAQSHRMHALADLAPRRPKRTALAKAMHIKSNPGVAGVVAAVKTLAPQIAVGAGSLVGLGLVGVKLGALANEKLTFIPASVQPYTPAIVTGLASVGAYVAADKFAPKYKGVVVLGGMLAAIVQAVVAASNGGNKLASQAVAALVAPGAGPAALPVGDYTTVGGRAYAEAGIFRNIGDYTTVGDAYSLQRPRRSERDNATEWAMNGMDDATEFAHDSLRGLDDATEFAAGEGGILSGGLFRGPSQR